MRDERLTSLAKNLVDYSLDLKKGEKLYIEVKGKETLNLAKELVTQTAKREAIPFWFYNDDSILRKWILNSSEEQMREFGEFHLMIMKAVDAYIILRGSDNFFDLADVPQQKMRWYQRHFYKPVHIDERIKYKRWCVLRYPSNSMAQLAQTSQEKFEDFFYDVCNLDYSKMSNSMNSLVKLMEKTDKVRIVAKDTDISFSIKGIPAVKCDGKRNVPDGEVYTAPARGSVNGYISFNAPAIYQGVNYEGVRLEFKDGKIVKSFSLANNEKLEALFNTDEGARYTGEFAIGLNPYIKKPLKDILFDEKIFGSIHLTPGSCYDEADNGNKSAIHLDLVLIQTEEYGGGEIYFDDQLIRKDGIFVHPELKDKLSEESLKT